MKHWFTGDARKELEGERERERERHGILFVVRLHKLD